ncbi:hypothetical protein DPMN_011775 [Dreissena polymorpha]|uniref:Uncharacterized protein n=1 Tax=Dreissena polymorpha TaxID=45954 RepID=A0A9D4N4N6_DREPO|nr:hypothetical protein DPMN_011775 [Dreissena polymorpha]
MDMVSPKPSGGQGFVPHSGSVLQISPIDTKNLFYPGKELKSLPISLRLLMQSR